jgi:SWI/SNF-related matrix-associated actin-dependent regulator of chromatin subfamily A member 5
VPKSTLTNWYNECTRWCPSLEVVRFHGDKANRAKVRAEYFDKEGPFDVCLTTYESCMAEKASIAKLAWRYLIIDEAHRIKNEESKLSVVVRMFTTHFRLLITGTPLQNDLHELWAMLNFLLPDVFESASTFDEYFNLSSSSDRGAADVLTQLHKILRPFLLRRLKADVEKDLPPKREIKLLIGLSEMQRRWYTNILEKNIDVLNAMGANRTRMLNMLMQLRKCANHPYLFEGAETPPFTNDERLINASGKMVVLDKLLTRLRSGGHRVLLFSQMTRLLDILEDYCAWREIRYCRIDGSTSGDLRDEQMVEFNAPQSPIFLFMLSTRAGGLGINLATADTVILFDSDWNPQIDLQAMDRAHRIGQTKPVVVYRFITQGTVEEKVVERAQRKLFLDAAVIQQGRLAEQSKALTKDEILAMVRFGADAVFSSAGMDPTEEDLDALLARGEEQTRRDTEKLSKQVNNLANFSLGAEEKSLYEYEGKDYGPKGKGDQWALSLPKRVTKQNYDENEFYRNALHGKDAKGAPKPPKPLALSDFQFFDLRRLEELRQVELRNYEYRKAQYDRRYSADAQAKDDAEKDAEMQRVAPPLSEEQLAEKEALMGQGFTSWTRKDLNNFIRGLEEYGRDNLPGAATFVEGKTDKEVGAYATTFFRRCTEIREWEKLMRRVEAGEARIARRSELDGHIAWKIARCQPAPLVSLRIDYGLLGGQGKAKTSFTVENDRFLICLVAECGYGRWEELQSVVRASWLFRFDWYMRTRTQAELAKRVELLARLIEREAELEAEAAKKARRQSKGGGGKAGAKRGAADDDGAPTPKRRRE